MLTLETPCETVKQCGSWSDHFVRSHLIWIDSIFKKGKFFSAGPGLNHSQYSFVDIWDTVWSLLNTPALLTVETRSGGHPQSGKPCESRSDGFVISQLIWIQCFHKKDKSGIRRTRVRGYIQCGIYSRSSVYNISWSELSGNPYLPLLSVNPKTLFLSFCWFPFISAVLGCPRYCWDILSMYGQRSTCFYYRRFSDFEFRSFISKVNPKFERHFSKSTTLHPSFLESFCRTNHNVQNR